MLRITRVIWPAILVLALLSTPPSTACDIYWAQGDGLYRAHADGSEVRLGLSGSTMMDLDIYPETGEAYFIDFENIRRVRLDGQGLETIFSHPNWEGWSFTNTYVTIDRVHQRVHHTYSVFEDAGGLWAMVASREFSGAIYGGAGAPYIFGVALDPANGWQYYSDGRIWRSLLDGSDAQLWFDPDNSAEGLAMDQESHVLYWAEPGPGRILRWTPAGAEEIVTGLDDPRDVAVDPFHGYVYWSDIGTGKIQRARVDRPVVQDVVTGISDLRHLTVDSRSVDLRMHRDELFWNALPGTLDYDVVKGDLETLRETAGDFEAATMDCLADNTHATGVELTETDPGPGEGFWYLSRAGFVGYVAGSYGGCASSQFAPRDAGLDQSPAGCP